MATTLKDNCGRREQLGDAMDAFLRKSVDSAVGQAPGKRMRGYNPRSTTTAHGKRAVWLGIPFLLVGLFIGSRGFWDVPVEVSTLSSPRLVVGLFGAIFAVPGLIFIVHGIVGMRREAKSTAGRNSFVGEPWRADYSWDEHGMRDTQVRGVWQMMYGAGFMLLFALPFNMIAFESGNGWAMAFVSVCVNLFVAVFAIALVYRLARWMKYGSGQVRFGRFPFFLGEKIELAYVPARGLRGVGKLTCTLRCIRERYEIHKSGTDNQEVVVPHETYCDVKEMDAAALGRSFDRSLPLAFDAPTGGEATHLSGRPMVYWELEIKAETRGVDLESRFLVPVYARVG